MKLISKKKRELDVQGKKELVKWQYLFLRVLRLRSHEVENFDAGNNFNLLLYEKLEKVFFSYL